LDQILTFLGRRFDLVKMGYLKMGIGSALDLKYLVRVKGRTADANDDVVLEIKEVRDLSGVECIQTGKARIAYRPFEHLGYFEFRRHNFWVHAWVDNYDEVDVEESFRSREELAEVAYDVGVQLGKGHVKHIAAPLDLQLKREQLQILDEHEAEIRQACEELAVQTVAAWKAFVERVPRS
jgi:hypothetical protein